MLRLLCRLLFTVIFSCGFIQGLEFPQCNNQPIESFIAVANNCTKAIYCKGADSIILDCDKDSPYFSAGDQKCHNETAVCGDRPFRLLNIPTTTTTLAIPTVATSIAITETNFPDNNIRPATTTSSIVSSSVTIATEPLVSNTIAQEQTFPTTLMPPKAATTIKESTTPPAVFTISSTEKTATSENVPVLVQCPIVDDPSKPLFLPHPKSCSQYYLCYHGVATLMKCPNKLHFDVTQQSCNTPEAAKCQVNFLMPREKCQLHTVNLYPHPINCNYYYLCEYGFLMVMQCPFKMYWDYEHRVCAMRSIAKCYNENSIY